MKLSFRFLRTAQWPLVIALILTLLYQSCGNLHFSKVLNPSNDTIAGNPKTASITFAQSAVAQATGVSSISVALSSKAQVGSLIVISVASSGGSGATEVSTINDNLGNSYSRAAESIREANLQSIYYAVNKSDDFIKVNVTF